MDSAADLHPRSYDLGQVTLVLDGFLLVRNGYDLTGVVVILADIGDFTVDLGDDSDTLRSTGFKEFFDTGQTLGDITGLGRNTAGVEVSQCQLGTRFTDCLGSHDTDGFANLDEVAGSHVAAIALAADTGRTFTGEHVADICFFDAGIDNFLCQIIRQIFISFDQNFTGFRMCNGLGCVTADDTVEEGFDQRIVLAVLDRGYEISLIGSAVIFVDDDFLGNVDETSCQVS